MLFCQLLKRKIMILFLGLFEDSIRYIIFINHVLHLYTYISDYLYANCSQ